jgi:hypothetical protein
VAFPRLRGGVSAAAHCAQLLCGGVGQPPVPPPLQGKGAMLIPEGLFAPSVGGGGDSRVRVGLGRVGMAEALPLWSHVLSNPSASSSS